MDDNEITALVGWPTEPEMAKFRILAEMKPMKRLIHWLAHKLGSNTGQVDTWWQGDKLMIGFRCGGCGKVSHAHESATSRQHKPESFGLPAYPEGDIAGPCVCGSWPGGKCLRCPVVRVGDD